MSLLISQSINLYINYYMCVKFLYFLFWYLFTLINNKFNFANFINFY